MNKLKIFEIWNITATLGGWWGLKSKELSSKIDWVRFSTTCVGALFFFCIFKSLEFVGSWVI